MTGATPARLREGLDARVAGVAAAGLAVAAHAPILVVVVVAAATTAALRLAGWG